MINNAAFRKAMEKVRKHRDIKIFITEKKRNYLVWKPDYHITKVLTEYLLAIEMEKKMQILMN